MSERKNNLVEMRGVRLQFAGKAILDGVAFSMQPEETLVVMGLSGSGKSTLLGILMGLLKPDAGSVIFKDEDLTKLSRPKLNDARTHLGMVYQNAALISSMSVSDNIKLPLQELTGKAGPESWNSSGWRTPRTSFPPNSAEECRSVLASRGRWHWSRNWCCSTSPPQASTQSTTS